MRGTYSELYVHLVWRTWDRLPLITKDFEADLYKAMMSKTHELKCELEAIGGTAENVHLLVRLHPTVSVSNLVKEIKGSTSHLATHVFLPGEFFKWQCSYSAFSLRKSDTSKLKAYISNQKQHHLQGSIVSAWEEHAQDDD